MRHLQSLAAAVALAVCALGCTPVTIMPPKPPRPYDVVAPTPTFGTLPSQSYYLAQATTANITTPTVIDSGMGLLCFHAVISPTGDPIGALALQGSLNGVNFADLYLDANKVYGNGTFAGGTSIAVNDPAATLSVIFCVEHPMPYSRVVYTRSSGGTAAGADFYTHALQN